MNFKLVASYDNFLLANMTLGLLRENNINCHLKDEYIVTMDAFLSAAVGGIKLMVAEADLAAAKVLIIEAENNYLKEIPCPKCKSHSLEVEEKINKPVSLLGKIKNMVAFGQTETYSKKYRCGNCQALIDELPLTF
jgi:hypothetical protein